MKGRVFKTAIVFLLVFTILLSNAAVLAEEVVNNIEEKAKALIEISISKYNNFNIEERKGTLLQFNVKTGIEYEEGQNYGPIKKTTTLVDIPELNGQLPERIEVIAQSTKATNGQTSNIQGNYSYDKEQGILQLIASNEGEEPYNQYDSSARDEYEVICIYGENAYTDQNEERSIEIKAVVSEDLYNEEIGSVTQTVTLPQTLTENIGSIISSDIRTETIYDGYIKSNIAHNTEYETSYKESMNVLISYKDIGEKIVIDQSNSWQDENEQNLDNIDNVIYKSTQISKQDMISILGENGTIKVLAQDGSVLQEINKDTEEIQEGIIEIIYPENTENIKLEFSTPVKEGIIRLQNNKVIKSSVTNLNAKRIVTNESISLSNEEVIENSQKITEIENAKSSVNLQIDNNGLGNGVTNNVVLTATLKSDSSEYNLFRNPVLRITLPAEVEKVVLGDVSILYGNGLNIVESNVIDNGDGNKEIVIQLDGEQTSYNADNINVGANIVIPANIVLKSDISSTQSVIKASYTNEVVSGNGYITEEGNCEDIPIDIINTVTSEEKDQEEEILSSDENQDSQNGNQQAPSEEVQGQGIELEVYAQVGDKRLENGDSIHTSEIIKYVVSVTNTTDTTMNNVQINCQVPENTVYATVDIGTYLEEAYDYIENPDLKEYGFVAETIEPGQTRTGFYEVVVKDIEEGVNEKQISNTVSASIGDIEYASETLENTLVKSNIDVYLKSYISRDIKNGFSYYLDVTNLTNETINNVKVESTEFQKEMNVLDAFYYTDDELALQKFGTYENGKLEGTIPTIEPGKTVTIEIIIEAYNFEDNVNEVPLTMSVKAYTDENDIYYSNENRRSAYPTYVTVKMSSDREGEEVRYGEEVTYTLEITNESKIRANAHVYDYLPEYLDPVSLEYERYIIQDDGFGDTMYDIEAEANISYELEKVEKDLSLIIDGQANVDEYLEIPAGKTVTMSIKATTVDTIETVQVSNYATAEKTEEDENIGIKTVTSNIVNFTLLAAYEDEEDPNTGNGGQGGNGDNNNGGTTAEPYSISGVAWLDANRDGKRDSSEQLMNGIEVKLYDASTQTIAQNENGETLRTTTNAQGGYEFNNIQNGNYWVLFEYDTGNYSLTSYQKGGVSATLNSDVIAKSVSIDGVEKNVGMTDTITIADNGLSNIDMGLVTNNKFDLKLDKYISQVVVETSSGTKTYSYENTQFTKVDIKAKEIANSSITVEYTIVITNEGDIEGYASQIVDYIPEGFTFNASDNKTWLKNENGDLVNTSLAGEFIQPGESKRLTLTLNKDLDEDSTGSVINAVEIGKSRTANNLSDVDSTAGNKNTSEDDYSQAELLISIETGVLTYTIITIVAIGILTLIILIIKGKIKIKPFKNNKIKNIFSIFMITGVLGIVLSSDVYGFSVKWSSGGVFTGSNDEKYVCGHTGWHMCAVNEHYYTGSGTIINSSTTTSDPVTVKDLILTKDDSAVDVIALDDKYNLIGPYKIKSNCADSYISAINVKYTQNGQAKESTTTNVIVDSKGNKMDLNMTQNKDYTFYIKASSTIEKINSLKITVTTKDAVRITTTTKYKLKYTCTSIGAGEHQNAAGEPTDASAATTQPVVTYKNLEKSTHEYKDASKPVSFGSVEIKGRIKINKIDPDADGDGKALEGIGFTLRMTSGKYEGYYVSADKNGNAVYAKEETTLITDKNGQIAIDLLEQGTYELIETVNPYYGYDELPKVINDNLTIKNGSNTVLTIENQRKYIKISGYAWEDIAWEEGKTTDTNQLYQDVADDINDKLLENITVRLRDNEGNIVQFKDEDGNLVDETVTDSNGKYTMVDVSIDDLDKYYIEFSYNGMAYESVDIIDIANPNGTEAIEGDNRTIFNENFAQITAGQSNDSGGTKINDIQYNTEDYKSTINYEGEYVYGYSDEQIEEVAPYTGITLEDYKTYYPVNGVADKYIISSTTYNAYTSVGQSGYLSDIINAEDIRENEITEIGTTFEEGINLGLKKRERPDLSVVKDVESAKVSIVGTQHVYKYGDRFNEELWAENSNGVSGHDLDPQVKFEEKYAEMTYSRPIYASDVYYDGTDDEEIRVEMTYKISVKNNSTNLGASIYELDDYFDSKYNLVAIGTDINADGSIMQGTEITEYTDVTEVNSEYKKVTIGGNNRAILELEPLQEKFVYVVLEVNKGNIIDIVESEDNEYAKLDNISEIKTYGVTKVNDNGQAEVYAGIDKDSQPGNTDVNDRTTWEDDTDKAPGMLLILTEEPGEPDEPGIERQVNGKVFLDTDVNSVDAGERVHTGVARQGNGQYDDGEQGIQNVKVTLLDAEGNIAQVYNEDTQTYEDGVTYTNENGEYTIGGFIPGEYQIQYTWGGNIDGSEIDSTYTLDNGDEQIVNVQNYKSTIVNETVWNAKGTEDKWYHDSFKQNYPGLEWNTDTNTEIRASDAVDDYDTRLAIDSEIGDMTYGEKQKLENTYDESSTGDKYTNTQMNSSTQNFNVYIEYEDTENLEDNITDQNIEEVNTVNSIDFGIIERARQLLELDKNITGVKITLANSNVLINAKLVDGVLQGQTQYVTVMPPSNANNGQIKVEIDQEVIQGATLNVEYGLKVTNSSELDYQTQEFYMYGVGHGENESAMVTLQPSLIIDYIDSNMLIDDSDPNSWTAVAQEDRADYLYDENSNPDGLLSENLEDTLNSSIRVITTEQLKDNVLKPIGNENETSITAVLNAQRLLSNNDETFLENNAEIIKVTRNNGGSVLITTPGNYVPSDSSTSEEDDSVSESVTIVPPTGTTTNTISYVIIAISSLAIIIAGIILIKRFVLK